MPAKLIRLHTPADRLRQDDAQQLRQLILAFGNCPARASREILHAIDLATASADGWTFLMINPQQNAAVVGWLARHSVRKGIAAHLWAEMLTATDRDTGEVLLSRDELANRVGTRPNGITDVLGELEAIGAISRRRERVPGMSGPGRVVVMINSRVATRLAGRAREQAQKDAQPVSEPVLPSTTGRRKLTNQHTIVLVK